MINLLNNLRYLKNNKGYTRNNKNNYKEFNLLDKDLQIINQTDVTDQKLLQQKDKHGKQWLLTNVTTIQLNTQRTQAKLKYTKVSKQLRWSSASNLLMLSRNKQVQQFLAVNIRRNINTLIYILSKSAPFDQMTDYSSETKCATDSYAVRIQTLFCCTQQLFEVGHEFIALLSPWLSTISHKCFLAT